VPKALKTMEPFFLVRSALLEKFPGAELVGFADQETPHLISVEGKREFDRLIDDGTLTRLSRGDEADPHVLDYARQTDAVVVSLDHYRDEEFKPYRPLVRQIRPERMGNVITFSVIKTIEDWLVTTPPTSRTYARSPAVPPLLAVGIGIHGIRTFRAPTSDDYYSTHANVLLKPGSTEPGQVAWFGETVEVKSDVLGTLKLVVESTGPRVHDTGIPFKSLVTQPGEYRIGLRFRANGNIDFVAQFEAAGGLKSTVVARLNSRYDDLKDEGR